MVYKVKGNLDNVRFAKIKDFDNYLICGSGAVYSLQKKSASKLKPEVTAKGYLRIDLYKDTARKHCRVHRLVAQAFIPNPQGFDTVDHIDGNKKNNCISNLQWLSNGDNTRKYHGKPLQDVQEAK